MGSSVDSNRMFSERILSTPAIFKHSSFSAYKAALRTKTELIFPALSLTLVDFAVQFCFCCKFSFYEKPFWVKFDRAWFFLTNHNSLLRYSNQWDCFILYRQQITSNGFFSCLPKWPKAGFRVIEKDFEINSWSCVLFLLYKTNRFHVSVRLFSK